LWSLLESHHDIKPFVDNAELNEGVYSTSESGIYIKKPNEAKRILKAFCRANKNFLVIEKTPSHTLRQKIILKDFPNSKSIIILRHPLAIANSMIHSEMQAFKNHDVNIAIAEIRKYFIELKYLIEKDCFFTLTYEQLSSNTNIILERIFKYLMIDHAEIHKIITENLGKSKVGVKGAYRKGKIKSYEEDLSDNQKAILTTSLAEEIKFYEQIYLEFENTCSK